MPSDLPLAAASAPSAPVRPAAASTDTLLSAALEAVGPALSAWHSALAGAADEIRGILARRGPSAGAARSLGVFGAGRIDLGRFAGLVERGEALEVGAVHALERASAVLSGAATASAAEQTVVRVPDGGRMREVVDAALTRLGRAFGAARVAALARQGRFRPEAEGGLLEGLPARAWTKRERRVAPPLVVSVAGADLDATSLVEALDGAAKVVLLVRGPATPAPLVRLVTPGTFVLENAGPTDLRAFANAEGPAVAALFEDASDDVATFVHDPAAGSTLTARLVVRRLPPVGTRSPVGGWSSAQQAEELGQLAALAERSVGRSGVAADAAPTAAPAPSGGAPAAEVPGRGGAPAKAADDPAGRLAAWLLGAVDLRDLRG